MRNIREKLFRLTRRAKKSLFATEQRSLLGPNKMELGHGIPAPLRAVLAVLTLLSLLLLTGLSVASLGILFAALLAMALLITKVLGVSLDVDPEALLRRIQTATPRR